MRINLNKKFFIVVVFSLICVFSAINVFAALTIGSSSLLSDQTLQLQNNSNPITTGSGLFTVGGNMSVAGSVTASSFSGIVSAPTGSLMPFAGSSLPSGWLLCDGSAVSRTTYASLFSVIGTTYGTGDGSTTFNLPDLRGRSVIGAGQGSGLTNRVLGSLGGEESHTMTLDELASHTHTGTATIVPRAGTGSVTLTNDPTNNYPAQAMPGTTVYTATSNANMGSFSTNFTTNSTGITTPFNVMQPFLTMNYIIKF